VYACQYDFYSHLCFCMISGIGGILRPRFPV
jgi:hypothetical protein